jgi:hypothetical protein
MSGINAHRLLLIVRSGARKCDASRTIEARVAAHSSRRPRCARAPQDEDGVCCAPTMSNSHASLSLPLWGGWRATLVREPGGVTRKDPTCCSLTLAASLPTRGRDKSVRRAFAFLSIQLSNSQRSAGPCFAQATGAPVFLSLEIRGSGAPTGASTNSRHACSLRYATGPCAPAWTSRPGMPRRPALHCGDFGPRDRTSGHGWSVLSITSRSAPLA